LLNQSAAGGRSGGQQDANDTKLILLVLAGWAGTAAAQTPPKTQPRPTVVLVHGAFAESSSWNSVVGEL
jgi:hypothetical protein